MGPLFGTSFVSKGPGLWPESSPDLWPLSKPAMILAWVRAVLRDVEGGHGVASLPVADEAEAVNDPVQEELK